MKSAIRTYRDNYNKPTPLNWQRIGDFMLVMIPVTLAVIPNLPISQTAQTWAMQIGPLLLVATKFWTKGKVDQNKYEG